MCYEIKELKNNKIGFIQHFNTTKNIYSLLKKFSLSQIFFNLLLKILYLHFVNKELRVITLLLHIMKNM